MMYAVQREQINVFGLRNTATVQLQKHAALTYNKKGMISALFTRVEHN